MEAPANGGGEGVDVGHHRLDHLGRALPESHNCGSLLARVIRVDPESESLRLTPPAWSSWPNSGTGRAFRVTTSESSILSNHSAYQVRVTASESRSGSELHSQSKSKRGRERDGRVGLGRSPGQRFQASESQLEISRPCRRSRRQVSAAAGSVRETGLRGGGTAVPDRGVGSR